VRTCFVSCQGVASCAFEAVLPAQDARAHTVLRAADAAIHGPGPRYETGDGKDDIGYLSRADSRAVCLGGKGRPIVRFNWNAN